MSAYWLKLIEGDEAGAGEILKSCAARGVPLPCELK